MTYNAIVEDTGPGGYTASILGWPGCTVKGATKDEALARLHQAIANRLSRVEIVPIEVDVPQNVHPLAKFAGMFKDDELFDQFRPEHGRLSARGGCREGGVPIPP